MCRASGAQFYTHRHPRRCRGLPCGRALRRLERESFRLTIHIYLLLCNSIMDFYSTAQAAKQLGISLMTLNRYIAAKKIPLPPVRIGGVRVRLWSEKDIQRVRRLLPKIANGRKTRYSKKKKKSK